MASQRCNYIKRCIHNIQGKLLDLGCTDGTLHTQLLPFGDVYGLDLLPSTFERFVVGDAEHLPFRANRFSVIVAGELIEHLSDPTQFLIDCFRTLKPRGILMLTTPNVDSWWNRLTLRRAYVAKGSHLHLMNEHAMRHQLGLCGFTIRQIIYLPYEEHAIMLATLRRFIHRLVPPTLRENMVIYCTK